MCPSYNFISSKSLYTGSNNPTNPRSNLIYWINSHFLRHWRQFWWSTLWMDSLDTVIPFVTNNISAWTNTFPNISVPLSINIIQYTYINLSSSLLTIFIVSSITHSTNTYIKHITVLVQIGFYFYLCSCDYIKYILHWLDLKFHPLLCFYFYSGTLLSPSTPLHI